MRGTWSVRQWSLALAAGLCLAVGGPALLAQGAPAPSPSAAPNSAPSPAPQKEDNPFPGDAPQAPGTVKPGLGSSPTAPQAGDATAKPASDNPFPGEDTDAPIIPVDPGPGPSPGPRSGRDAGRGAESAGDSARSQRRDADPDGDPVRTPDGAGNVVTDDGYSSSRSGLNQVPVEDDSDERPGKSTKNKTREQLIKEDVDVGSYYLDRKNWKAAQGRFASAFGLDSENPDAVWGLAEAERHLQLYQEAAGHYKLFLSYEPEGRRGREARKSLEEVEAARPATSATTKAMSPDGIPHP